MWRRSKNDDWCACVKEDKELQAKEELLKSSLKTLKEKIHALRVENRYLTSLLEKQEDEEQYSVNDFSDEDVDRVVVVKARKRKFSLRSIRFRVQLFFATASRQFVNNVIFAVFFSFGVLLYCYLYFR